MIEREALLKTLQLLKPAIATKDLIPEMCHIWFTGEQAIAGNDTGFGICVPCDLDFKGGLRGSVLLGLLGASKAKELELDLDSDKLVVKMGKTKLTMTPLDLETMMTELPKESNKAFKVPVELLAAIGKVMLSTGNETSSQPEQTGVTLIKQDVVHVFASDDATISWVKCKEDVPIKEGKRVLLPTAFAEQLLSMSKGVDDTQLYIGKSYVYAKNERMLTFARLIGEEDPSDLVTICKDLLKDAKPIAIPARLKFALARTFALMDKGKDDKKYVKLIVSKDTLKMMTKSDLGSLKDLMPLEESHPDAKINVEPKVLKRALPVCQRMFITPGAMVLSGKGFTYFISERDIKE